MATDIAVSFTQTFFQNSKKGLSAVQINSFYVMEVDQEVRAHVWYLTHNCLNLVLQIKFSKNLLFFVFNFNLRGVSAVVAASVFSEGRVFYL